MKFWSQWILWWFFFPFFRTHLLNIHKHNDTNINKLSIVTSTAECSSEIKWNARSFSFCLFLPVFVFFLLLISYLFRFHTLIRFFTWHLICLSVYTGDGKKKKNFCKKCLKFIYRSHHLINFSFTLMNDLLPLIESKQILDCKPLSNEYSS